MISRKTRIFAIGLALCGLATIGAFTSASGQQPASDVVVKVDLLTNRIWSEQNPSNGLPGVMTTFLSDGTLLQDSCWETYSVTRWKRLAQKKLSWDENGIPVSADVKSVSEKELVLSISAGKDKIDHRYVPVKTPYLCPDMKR